MQMWVVILNTYSFLSEIQAKEQKSCSRSNSIAPSGSIGKCNVRRMKGCAERWYPNQEEGQTIENPRERENIDRWLQPEQGIPYSRSSQKHPAKNIELKVVLPVLTGQQSNLKACSTKCLHQICQSFLTSGCIATNLANGDHNCINWPTAYFS